MITSSKFDACGHSDEQPRSLLFSAPLRVLLLLTLLFSSTARGQNATVKQAGRIDLSGASVRGWQPATRTIGEVAPVAYDSPIVGTVFEPACGCDTVCDCPGTFEPVCGLEPSCGFEPGRGLEPGCGIETFEPGCGLEPSCGFDGCDGMNPNCDACVGGVPGFIDQLFPRLKVRWERYDFFAGVNGFTGPMNFANVSGTGTDRDGAGSFGFYEGYNRGYSLDFFGTDLAYQSGLRFTQTNLSGAGFTDESREQVFLTSGLFRRVDYGFQFGLVLDYQYEDWYFRSDLIQLRGELSWVTRERDVWGFKFAAGVDDDTALTSVIDDTGQIVRNNIAVESTTQYRLFHRQHFSNAGLFEGFVGWTENEDGLLGVEFDLPIHDNWMWNTSATYLIPNEGTALAGHTQEGWNLMIGFTYRPGGLRCGSRYSRPLMKVADNGTFLVDRR
ncbi:MAG: DUF6666 family protein [Planctomycetota bacterium]